MVGVGGGGAAATTRVAVGRGGEVRVGDGRGAVLVGTIGGGTSVGGTSRVGGTGVKVGRVEATAEAMVFVGPIACGDFAGAGRKKVRVSVIWHPSKTNPRTIPSRICLCKDRERNSHLLLRPSLN